VLYIVHFTAFCLGGPFFSGHGVHFGYKSTWFVRLARNFVWRREIWPQWLL